MEKVKKKKIPRFQVGYISYPGLNQNKVFKDQVEGNMGLTFDKKTSIPIKILLNQYNNNLLAILIFYENIKTNIFKMIGSFIYCIMNNYNFDYYLCLHQAQLFL